MVHRYISLDPAQKPGKSCSLCKGLQFGENLFHTHFPPPIFTLKNDVAM